MKKLICIILMCFAYASVNAQTMNVTYKSVSGTGTNYSINATYPQVNFGPEALMGARGNAAYINNFFDSTVTGIVNNFKKQMTFMPEDAANGNPSSLEITSQAWVSNGSLLSSELTIFNNVAGMAHPLTTISAYNFSDNGGGPYALSDLFLSDAEYLNYISTVCIQQLSANVEKQGYDNIKDMILSGASADAKNFTEWVVKNDNLDIIFNVYQVAPYVMGIQRVSIPLSDMTKMIDPKGPLSFMFR